jgi:hypothetical protein
MMPAVDANGQVDRRKRPLQGIISEINANSTRGKLIRCTLPPGVRPINNAKRNVTFCLPLSSSNAGLVGPVLPWKVPTKWPQKPWTSAGVVSGAAADSANSSSADSMLNVVSVAQSYATYPSITSSDCNNMCGGQEFCYYGKMVKSDTCNGCW